MDKRWQAEESEHLLRTVLFFSLIYTVSPVLKYRQFDVLVKLQKGNQRQEICFVLLVDLKSLFLGTTKPLTT